MTRLKDPSAIEARLLELAHTTDAKITAPALAFFAPCSIEDAARVLDDLTTKSQLTMEVEDDGTIVYQMFGRQKLAAPAAPAFTGLRREVMSPFSHALVHAPQRLPAGRTASPLLAGFLSLWIPGAGHLYAGRVMAAFLWFVVVGMGYVLFFPGLVLHLFAIASAAASAHRLNLANHPHRLLAAA